MAAALDRLLPFLAVGTMVLTVGATLAVAGDTLGYDFRAYHAAAVRVLDGQPAYDLAFDLAGAFGLFFYPPTFVPLVLPFGLMPEPIAIQAWIGVMLFAFAIAVLSMPVAWRTRWLIVLLAALSWPFVYNIKLGQVGPLLLLCFAVAWRWIDRPWVFGIASGVGAAVKVQPGLLLVWALLRRRWWSVIAGALTLAILAAVGFVATGPEAWPQFIGLLARVSDPIATPQNATPGAVAWQLGASRETAGIIQGVSTVMVALVFVVCTLWLPLEASFLVAVITTQLVSPVLWDHYAIVLLLPTAWLLDRGRWWAAAIPLVTPVLLVGVTPAWIYPVAYWVCLASVVLVGLRDERDFLTGRNGSIAPPSPWLR